MLELRSITLDEFERCMSTELRATKPDEIKNFYAEVRVSSAGRKPFVGFPSIPFSLARLSWSDAVRFRGDATSTPPKFNRKKPWDYARELYRR